MELTVGPNEKDNYGFGELLKKIRASRRMTRAAAAKDLNISAEYLRLIERGMRVPAFGLMPEMLELYDQHTYAIHGDDTIVFTSSWGTHSVTFTSRIRARRGEKMAPMFNRNEKIGAIVRLLVTADETILRNIETILKED
jgi:transcriptional regulator with XRE-family HTH domain